MEIKAKQKYYVVGHYDKEVISIHRKVERALANCNKLKDYPTDVVDSEGNKWDVDFEGKARITQFKS